MTITNIRIPASTSELGEWPDLSEPEMRAQLTPAAVAGMARLAERWRLTVPHITQLLGGVSASTWHSWQNTPPVALSVDVLTRVSLLLGIFTSLHVLHSDDLADTWVQRPNSNPIFAGNTPLEVMLRGGIPALVEVRALLDGRRGGM